MRTYAAEQAWLPDGVHTGVRLTVDAGRFTRVADEPAHPGDHRLAGLVLPGFANTHSHAFHRALRGRTNGAGGTFWTWRDAMYRLADRLDPDSYLALARATYAEMVLAGVSAVGEFHYLHHQAGGRRYADPNAMGRALIAAARDAGLRLTLLDACYLSADLGGTPLTGTQLRFGDGTAEAWSERRAELRADQNTVIGAAIHSVRAVAERDLPTVVAAAAGQPLHVHLSEQPAENEQCERVYGLTPTALLERAGVLGPRTTAVHATHLTGDDIGRLGNGGVAISYCATTERDLADGIGPARALAEAGCPITLGSDQHVVIDPFEEARGLESHARLASGRRGCFAPDELLAAMTTAGHRALGWPDAGELVIGARADLVAVGLDSVRTAGTDPGQLVFAAGAPDVTTVVTAGRIVVEDGRHRLGDVASLLAAAIAPLWP